MWERRPRSPGGSAADGGRVRRPDVVRQCWDPGGGEWAPGRGGGPRDPLSRGGAAADRLPPGRAAAEVRGGGRPEGPALFDIDTTGSIRAKYSKYHSCP